MILEFPSFVGLESAWQQSGATSFLPNSKEKKQGEEESSSSWLLSITTYNFASKRMRRVENLTLILLLPHCWTFQGRARFFTVGRTQAKN